MRVVALLALVACTGPVAPAPIAPPAPTSLPAAAALLAEMYATYANANSYADTGLIQTTVTSAGSSPSITQVAFQTSFSRPALRFELGVNTPRARAAIWSDGVTTRSESSLRPGRIDETDNLGAALDAAAATSRLASVLVPAFLVPGDTGLFMHDGTVTGIERVADHDCWHLHTSFHDDVFELWIDRSAHVLRQFARRTSDIRTAAPRVDLSTTITYEPVVGQSVAVAPIDATGKTVVDNSDPPWIGIRFDGATTRVLQVMPNGPALAAGLHDGDEIISIDGQSVARSADVVDRVRRAKRGTKLGLQIRRAGATIDIPVAPQAMPRIDKLAHDALIDKPAPAFALPVVNGSGTADLSHDVVVVDFWASWCKPCALMVPHLNELAAKHGAKLSIVAITNDPAEDVADYLQAHAINYPVARDTDGKITSAYLVGVLPMTVVIVKGIVRFVGVGYGDETELDATIARAVGVR